ncbi:hypothetical protein [Arthrobacter sp. H14]|nr:hypothetical protein [Arthrobacter sp. H14]
MRTASTHSAQATSLQSVLPATATATPTTKAAFHQPANKWFGYSRHRSSV